MRKRKFEMHKFLCPSCGNSLYLPRAMSKRRETGHIKTMWCPYCKEMRNFTECSYFSEYTTME